MSSANRLTVRLTSSSSNSRSASRSNCHARSLFGTGFCPFFPGSQRIDKLAKFGGYFGMTHREQHIGFQVTQLRAAIIADALELMGDCALRCEQGGNAISQLDFTASPRFYSFKMAENFGVKHIAADHRQGRWRYIRFRFFDNSRNAMHATLAGLGPDNAIAGGFIAGDGLHGKDRAALAGVDID